jgi:hypothetical protein
VVVRVVAWWSALSRGGPRCRVVVRVVAWWSAWSRGGPHGCRVVVCITVAWSSTSLSHHHPHRCRIVVRIVVEVPSSHRIVTSCGGLVMRWRVEVFHVLTFMVPYPDLLVLPWGRVVVLSHRRVTSSHRVGGLVMRWAG